MKTVSVRAARPYEVCIEPGLLSRAGALTLEKLAFCRLCVITDDIVAELYLPKVKASLESVGYQVVPLVLPHGEAQKRMKTIANILEFLAEHEFTRSDAVFALGGGVVGDMAGFAASVYLRGISVVQAPTTLLAQVDSSIGGKTGVDLSAGKNLAGAFYPPVFVLCDTDALSTLSDEIFAQGMAEVIKYGVIFDKELFDAVSGDQYDLAAVVERSVILKRDVVERDEYEQGERKLLNFGHTAGHAIERLSGFTVPHGEAVGIGMVLFSRAAFRSGFTAEDFSPVIRKTLERYHLPTRCDYTADELADACLSDKKRSGSTITLVLPKAIGHCVLHTMDVKDLRAFIQLGLED